MRRRPSRAAHNRPLAPWSSGSPPSPIPDESIRWLVNWMRAVTPSTGGAASASWIASGSAFGGGAEPPPVAAIASAVPAPIAATSAAQRASRRRVEIRRKKLISGLRGGSLTMTLRRLPERSLTIRVRATRRTGRWPFTDVRCRTQCPGFRCRYVLDAAGQRQDHHRGPPGRGLGPPAALALRREAGRLLRRRQPRARDRLRAGREPLVGSGRGERAVTGGGHAAQAEDEERHDG